MPEHLDLFDALGIKVWIGGGWGVDALLGKQTREHDDLDIVIEGRDCETLRAALEERGFEGIYTDDQSAWNFVMADPSGRPIDFHVVDLAEDGTGIYGPAENGDFPAESLTGTGVIGGRTSWLQPRWEYMYFHPLIRDVDLGPIGIWEADGEIVAAVHPEHFTGAIYLQIDPAHGDLRGEMLEYAEEHLSAVKAGRRPLEVYVSDSDDELRRIAMERRCLCSTSPTIFRRPSFLTALP